MQPVKTRRPFFVKYTTHKSVPLTAVFMRKVNNGHFMWLFRIVQSNGVNHFSVDKTGALSRF